MLKIKSLNFLLTPLLLFLIFGTGCQDEANVLDFGEPVTFTKEAEKINTVSISYENPYFDYYHGGVSQRLSVREEGMMVNSIWSSSGSNIFAQAFFDQNLNLEGFGEDVGIFEIGPEMEMHVYPASIVTYSDLNPGIVVVESNTGIDPQTKKIKFFGSKNQGQSFDIGPVTIGSLDPAEEQTQPSLAIDQQDVTHLVYSSETNSLPILYYTQSHDFGESWSEPIDLTGHGDANFFPQVTTSADGKNIYICYSKFLYQEEKAAVFVMRSIDDGESFETPVRLSNGDYAAECKIALGPEGNLYVSYYAHYLNKIFLHTSFDKGLTFGQAVQVNNTQLTQGEVDRFRMSLDSSGNIDFVYSSMDELHHRRSTGHGQIFSPSTVLAVSKKGGDILPYGLVSDSLGRLHIQYLSADSDESPLSFYQYYLISD